MDRFVHRLSLLLAPLIIQLQVASAGAETLDQSTPALSILERPSPGICGFSGRYRDLKKAHWCRLIALKSVISVR